MTARSAAGIDLFFTYDVSQENLLPNATAADLVTRLVSRFNEFQDLNARKKNTSNCRNSIVDIYADKK